MQLLVKPIFGPNTQSENDKRSPIILAPKTLEKLILLFLKLYLSFSKTLSQRSPNWEIGECYGAIEAWIMEINHQGSTYSILQACYLIKPFNPSIFSIYLFLDLYCKLMNCWVNCMTQTHYIVVVMFLKPLRRNTHWYAWTNRSNWTN